MDNIIIMGSDCAFIDKLIGHLHSEFLIKDLGSLHYFLGVEVLPRKEDFYPCTEQVHHEYLMSH